jgi:hypothetical protein
MAGKGESEVRISLPQRVLFSVSALLLIAAFFIPSQAAAGGSAKAAEKAALEWLKLVDKGDYITSWKESGAFFQGAMAAEKWSELINGVRVPLGQVTSRKLAAAQARKTMPGAPDGEYYILQFKSSFTSKASAVESVTVINEKGRGWRVVGYFIK